MPIVSNFPSGIGLPDGGSLNQVLTIGANGEAEWKDLPDSLNQEEGDARYLKKAGDTMAGAIDMGAHKITNLAVPTDPTDAVRQQDLEAVSNELDDIINGTTAIHMPIADEVKAGVVKSGGDVVVGEDGTMTVEGFIPTSMKGVTSGVAELDSNGKVPTSQLPSYVDEVIEYTSRGAFPGTGEDGKIYVAEDTNLTYRWSGTDYVEISPSLALGETESTAYRGDRGAAAYTHSQITSGNPHGTTAADVGAMPAVSGGTQGQILTQGANGAEWADAPDPLPAGGTTGQLLTKTADGSAWQNKPSYTAAEVGARPDTWTPSAEDVGAMPAVTGGTTGQVLTKTADGQEWADGGMTEAEADERYLKLSGGTMTGRIYVTGNVVSPFTLLSIIGSSTGGSFVKVGSDGRGGTFFYFDSASSGKGMLYIRTDGDEDDSPCLICNIATPTNGTDAANKAYVDSKAPTGQTVTLTSSGWTSTTGGYQQVVSVTGVTTDPAQIIWVDVSQSGTDLAADKALNDAWGAGPGQLKPKQQSGALQFFSIEKPTVNIPVDVVVSG